MGKLARQHRLIEMLGDTGQVLVSEAASVLGVSDDTIRRDLADLDKKGFLHKTHGGAVSIDIGGMARTERAKLLADEKRRIGAAAAQAVQPGSTLLLDAGSTTLAMADALAVAVTIVTNSLDIANTVEGRPDVRLILAGGAWDPSQRLFSGAAARAILDLHRVDLAVLGACAVSVAGDVTANEERDAEMKRAMFNSATEAWLLADHSKFGQVAPHKIVSMSRFSRIFTDRRPAAYDHGEPPPNLVIAS